MSEENRLVGPIDDPGTSQGAQQPRPPRNLQDLLRFSVEAGEQAGAQPRNSSLQPLSEEVSP